MKKLIDLKCGDPIYILKITRAGVIYDFEETKCLNISKNDESIDIYYFNGEYDSFFSLEDEEDKKTSELKETKFHFYSDIEAVSEKLTVYKDELNLKQDLLNKIYEKSGIRSRRF